MISFLILMQVPNPMTPFPDTSLNICVGGVYIMTPFPDTSLNTSLGLDTSLDPVAHPKSDDAPNLTLYLNLNRQRD